MEVACACFVFALTLVGMIGVIESGAKMQSLSRQQTLAAQILRNDMEKLRTYDFSVISAYSSHATSMAIDTGFNATAQGFSETRTATTLQTDSSYNPTLMQVTYTVTWTGITGTTYTRSSTTYVGKNGLSLTYQRS